MSFEDVWIFDDYKVKVYEDGRVETYDFNYIRSNGKPMNRKGRFLRPSIDTDGYYRCVFSFKGKRRTVPVHKLVALAFIPNPENKETVNHINGIKTDNRVENLEWATQKEQKAHSIAHGLCIKNIEALSEANKRRSKPILFEDSLYPSIRAARRITGYAEDTIKKYGKVVM